MKKLFSENWKTYRDKQRDLKKWYYWFSGIKKFPLSYRKVRRFPPKIPWWYRYTPSNSNSSRTKKKQFWHRQCAVGHRWRRSHDVTVRVYWSREKWGGWGGRGGQPGLNVRSSAVYFNPCASRLIQLRFVLSNFSCNTAGVFKGKSESYTC